MASIKFDSVSLEYPVRENQTFTLKEFVLQRVLRLRQFSAMRTVKALTDLSFEINDGERIGIIGRNGAGKSTLLRTIGGIYPILHGRSVIEGDVWSLFDIALGFEPDATGRQNVYYRSYLQGETPQEVKAKLPDIEEFTELGEFLDLPIRCYSTGMLMRLAFAIATSQHPEILLVDEVFATGDLAFRKKAEARMRNLLHKARIVVMVGHDLNFLQEFCTRIFWMDKGRLIATGPADEIIGAYSGETEKLKKAA